jgi:hypothetical protein
MAISDLIVTMVICLFVMGVISIGAGVYILLSKVVGEDIRTIATQTAKLAEKGLAEDMAGLVGNASSLVDALNQLVKTTSGVGAFMIIIGFVFIGAAYYLIVQIS